MKESKTSNENRTRNKHLGLGAEQESEKVLAASLPCGFSARPHSRLFAVMMMSSLHDKTNKPRQGESEREKYYTKLIRGEQRACLACACVSFAFRNFAFFLLPQPEGDGAEFSLSSSCMARDTREKKSFPLPKWTFFALFPRDDHPRERTRVFFFVCFLHFHTLLASLSDCFV